MTGPLIVPGDLFARHQIVSGLRALADFLEANPAVPVDEYGETFTLFTDGPDDQTERAQVDQVAGLLGVQVDDRTTLGGHYTAAKSFGRVRYRIVHIPARQRAEHTARASYDTNIRIDQPAGHAA